MALPHGGPLRADRVRLHGRVPARRGGGLLDGRSATTHWEDIADLRAMFPKIAVRENARWIDEGRIMTSAGISAGIDLSLHAVERLAGRELAIRTARQMEFDWVGGKSEPV